MTHHPVDIEEMPRIIAEQAREIEDGARRLRAMVYRATAAEAEVERLEEALAKSHDFHGDQARAIAAAEVREARLRDGLAEIANKKIVPHEQNHDMALFYARWVRDLQTIAHAALTEGETHE